MVFVCRTCNYETEFKSNYTKHLNTKKHIRNLDNGSNNIHHDENKKLKIELENLKNEFNKLKYNDINIENSHTVGNTKLIKPTKVLECSTNIASCSIDIAKTSNDHICTYCCQKYKHRSSLYRHCKDCYYKKTNKNDINITFINGVSTSTRLHKYPQVSTKNNDTIMHEYVCQYCQNNYTNSRGLSKHIQKCSKYFYQREQIILEKDLEKEKAVNLEKDKIIEIAKNSKGNITNITTNNNNNRTINYLNTHYGNMIAMEHFLYNLEHNEKLTFKERENLLISYKENGIDVFARNFSYIMKQNCKRQLEKEGLIDMKLLPLFCSDGNLRSHKEKSVDGWKTHYDNTSINKMLNISNDQVYESHQELLPIVGKERTRIYKEIKRSNHQNKIKLIGNNQTIKKII